MKRMWNRESDTGYWWCYVIQWHRLLMLLFSDTVYRCCYSVTQSIDVVIKWHRLLMLLFSDTVYRCCYSVTQTIDVAIQWHSLSMLLFSDTVYFFVVIQWHSLYWCCYSVTQSIFMLLFSDTVYILVVIQWLSLYWSCYVVIQWLSLWIMLGCYSVTQSMDHVMLLFSDSVCWLCYVVLFSDSGRGWRYTVWLSSATSTSFQTTLSRRWFQGQT